MSYVCVIKQSCNVYDKIIQRKKKKSLKNQLFSQCKINAIVRLKTESIFA
jgi:hypothetical protein